MEQAQNKFEIEFTTSSHLMTENTATCHNTTNQNRFIPYHFKGLTPEQQERIMSERQQQIRDKKVERHNEAMEEKAWAIQQEANRQIMFQNEVELGEKQKQMMGQMKQTSKTDNIDKQGRWHNYYGERDNLPEVTQ